MRDSFFSVSFDLISIERPLPYDLYINSSIIEAREKFVRILKAGDTLTREDLQRFKIKYHQIYVKEEQRSKFLKSLISLKEDPADASPDPAAGTGTVSALDVKKSTVLKETAIQHLETLFQAPPTEVIGETIVGCRDVVESMIDVLQDYNIDKLRELIGKLSFHDFYTFDHSINVSMYCIMIYQTLNPQASRDEIVHVGLAGLLHDLGKIKIPTEIINNAGKLSDEEFNTIKKHPEYGRELLGQSASNLPPDLRPELLGRIVCEHHENFDGTGYPFKLAGEQIHLLARITSIADFFDAITTKRSYHEPLSIEDAVAMMTKFEGKKIDPKLFRLFVQHAQSFIKRRDTKLELTGDFDPCQPCSHLPVTITHAATDTTSQDFGKVKVIREPVVPHKDYGKVKVLGGQEPPKVPFKKKS